MTTAPINWNKNYQLSTVAQTNATANNVLCAFTGGNATASTGVSTLQLPIPTALQADLDEIEALREQVAQALSPRSTRSPAAAIVGRLGGGEDLDSTDVLLEIHETILRASGEYEPVLRQVNGLLDHQRADAVERHADGLMEVLREAAAPMFKRVRAYLDLNTGVLLDDREGRPSNDAITAWAMARDADTDLAKIGQVIGSLGRLMNIDGVGGLLLFAELTDGDMDALSAYYSIPRMDLRAPWLALASADEGSLASPQEWKEREEKRAEQSARAFEAAATKRSNAWKGVSR